MPNGDDERQPWWMRAIPVVGGALPGDYLQNLLRGLQGITGQRQAPQPTRISARAAGIFERAGQPLPPGATVAPTRPGEQAAAMRALIEAGAPPSGIAERGLAGGVPSQPTEPPPQGFRWSFDREANRWVPQFTGLGPQQRSQQELAQQQLELQRQQQAFQQQQAGQLSPFQQEQLELERQRFERAGEISPFQQQQFETQEQQFQQGLQFQQAQQAQAQQQFQAQLQFQQEQAQLAAQEQERQYRSQLAANPINWLQYSAYTGEQPVIQPWMVPLGFQNTGGTIAPQGLQAGQPIPGFGGQAGQQGQQTFADLPQLTTPSAQLQARWGPTAQAQFLGYRQARTGATPQETQFRLGAGRAPTGRFGGFSSFR